MKVRKIVVDIESKQYERTFKEYSDKKRNGLNINNEIMGIAEEIFNNCPFLELENATNEARKELEKLFSKGDIEKFNLIQLPSIKENINHYRLWNIENLIQKNFKIL